MPRVHASRSLSLLLGLSLSACAFSVLAYRARAEHVSHAHAKHTVAPRTHSENTALWEPKRNGAELIAPPREKQHGPIMVPNFHGKRVSLARREAHALGLKLVAFDAAGESIRGQLGPVYRIDTQEVAAGERVPPGAPIEVRAHEVEPIAVGY